MISKTNEGEEKMTTQTFSKTEQFNQVLAGHLQSADRGQRERARKVEETGFDIDKIESILGMPLRISDSPRGYQLQFRGSDEGKMLKIGFYPFNTPYFEVWINGTVANHLSLLIRRELKKIDCRYNDVWLELSGDATLRIIPFMKKDGRAAKVDVELFLTPGTCANIRYYWLEPED